MLTQKRKIKYFVLMLFLLSATSLSACSEEKNPMNTELFYTDYSKETESIEISELMSKNRTTYCTEDGTYPDWMELHNISDESINLHGWAITDGSRECIIPDMILKSDEYKVITCDNSIKFSLKTGEKISLKDPNGDEAKSVSICDMDADFSMNLSPNGDYEISKYPTPGYENSKKGYLQFELSRKTPSSLIINEVMVSNSSYVPLPKNQFSDWVEMKNNSSDDIQLSDYYLSDKNNKRLLWQLPEKILKPGELFLLYCDDDIVIEDDVFSRIKASDYVIAPFSLSCTNETLWLTDKNEINVDSVNLRDVPVNGSYGRMEDENGFFFFETPSPYIPNYDGKRFVTERPEALQNSGVYNNVKEIIVELVGEGDIYYTTDSSVPTQNSELYSKPIVLDATSVIRAICVKDGECKSKVASFSYIINENHALPILSLINDNKQKFDGMYSSGTKGIEYPANLALYEDGEERFNRACGVTLKGWTSLKQPKKSLGVYFRGKYGDGNVKNCDLFGNGISEYSSLSIRAGQDYRFSVVRNELMQELCLEMTDKVPTQHGKYCILYVDGEYYGIYCLKENMNEQFYADWAGVSKKSVTAQRGPAALKSEVEQILTFAGNNDMSKQENYDYFCSKFDIDNIIDWLILEGYSANTDTQGNIRYFKSDENDGKYRAAFYDLDWSLENDDAIFYNVLDGFGNSGYQIYMMTISLLRNEEFKDAFLKRYAEVSKTVLSDEHVISTLERLAAVVEPEIERDFPTWGVSVTSWEHRLDSVRNFIDRYYSEKTINIISYCLKLTEEEKALYFG